METIGSVVKEELLKTVDHHILPNTLVLQNLEPFPGYHGTNLPTDKTPDTFFCITSEEYPFDKVFRIAHNIKLFSDFKFKASPGIIYFGNDQFPFVRLRGLNDYSPLSEIQQFFKDSGVNFQRKKEIEALGLIDLKKIFLLDKVTDHIFHDKEDAMNYLCIYKQLTWGRFKKLTAWVKNNIDDNNFDAALAVAFGSKVYDFIRIYSNVNDIGKLETIRQMYIEGIKKTE